MPTHRSLQPTDLSSASAHWGAPRPPSLATIAVIGLACAVVLAIAAAVLPIARVPFLIAAVLIAVPSAIVAFQRTRSMPGGDRDLHALGHDASLTDPLTGAGNAEALEAALDAAVLDPRTAPITLLRLALGTAPSSPTIASPVGLSLADPGSGLPAASGVSAGASSTQPIVPSVPPAFGAAPEDDAAGEQRRTIVLAAVRWLEILRPGDLLVRTRDGEFAIVLPRCNARAAQAVINRIAAAVPDGAVLAVGLATWDGEETTASLRRRADLALDEERHVLTHDPITDPVRVAAVEATGLAQRRQFEEFDEIAAGVAWLLRTPVVVITLFDASWQHFIGQAGVVDGGGSADGTPVRDAICRQTVATGRPLVVSDTTRHPELREVPAARDLGVMACASVPIKDAAGNVLGSVCSMVLERHPWSTEDVGLLKLTADRVAERLAEAPAQTLSVA
jgi:GAF domain-containing protein